MNTTAGIIIIGDEILSGKFAEENASFLIRALADLHVNLGRVAFIPDDLEDIAHTTRSFSERFDWVFTSGGIGPTHDDLTMAGIAHGFATQVIIHEELKRMLYDYWGPSMPEANLRLAQVPEGAELARGENSRWPVVYFRNIYILPGVPRFFRAKFRDIQERFCGAPQQLARLYVDADEGAIAPILDHAVEHHPAVKIGSYPRYEETDFRVIITVESRETDAVNRACTYIEAQLGERLVRSERPSSP